MFGFLSIFSKILLCHCLKKNYTYVLIYNFIFAETSSNPFIKAIFEDFTFNETKEENYKHQCNIPSHLHVEITYSNVSSIYRMNGFKVNYFPEKWSWICQNRLTNQHNKNFARCENKR